MVVAYRNETKALRAAAEAPVICWQAGGIRDVADLMRSTNWRYRLQRWYEHHRYDFVFYRCLEKRAMLPGSIFSRETKCVNSAVSTVPMPGTSPSSTDARSTVWDIDPESVSTAQQFNTTEQTRFLVASSESLPFADECFDKMYGISVLEHFADPQVALQEVYRCLKPGGLVVLTTDSFGLGEQWPGTHSSMRRNMAFSTITMVQN